MNPLDLPELLYVDFLYICVPMVLKQCRMAFFSVLYREVLFGTIGYKELSYSIPHVHP